ncbi:MAG: nucleotidyltransferase family protein [Ignavibacteriaceae bacterium]
MKAFILAAGLGKRLRPLTDTVPKALVKVNGIPLLEILLGKLKSSGFDEIVINIHHMGEQIIKFLKDNHSFGLKIEISDESDRLLGTGGALKKAASFFEHEKTFLVHNVDVISDIDLTKLINYHSLKNHLATLVVRKRESNRLLLFDKELQLCGWKDNKKNQVRISKENIPVQKELAFNGIQVLNPEIFRFFPGREVFSLIDLYLNASVTEKITGYEDNESFWIDAGKEETLKEAAEILRLRDNDPV